MTDSSLMLVLHKDVRIAIVLLRATVNTIPINRNLAHDTREFYASENGWCLKWRCARKDARKNTQDM